MGNGKGHVNSNKKGESLPWAELLTDVDRVADSREQLCPRERPSQVYYIRCPSILYYYPLDDSIFWNKKIQVAKAAKHIQATWIRYFFIYSHSIVEGGFEEMS